jgi:hypothetical protein
VKVGADPEKKDRVGDAKGIQFFQGRQGSIGPRELSKRTPYTQSPGPSYEALLRIIYRSSSFDDASNSDRQISASKGPW